MLVERAESLATRGRWSDARALFSAAITADPSPAARISFGVFLAERNMDDEAILQLEQAWEEAKLRNRADLRAICCQNLSNIYRRRENTTLATQFQQLATAAEMETEQFHTEASLSSGMLTCSANRFSDDSELEPAMSLFAGAARTCGNDLPARATIEANTGVTLARMHRTGLALQRLVKAHRLHRDAGDLAGCAHDLLNIGHLLQARSRHVEAHRCFRLAAELFTRLESTVQADASTQFALEALRVKSIESCNPAWN